MPKNIEFNEKTWVELDSQTLLSNLENIRSITDPRTDIMAVIKANAYGHGLPPILEILETTSIVDQYGVFDFEDALFIRTKSKKPILVFLNTDNTFFKIAAKNNISITISSLENLVALKNYKEKTKLKIHLKLDTGLGRQGFMISDAKKVLNIVKDLSKNIVIEGLYTHFSGTEEEKFDHYTTLQISILGQWRELFKNINLYPIIHGSATSGTIRFPNYDFDMARIGIGSYGLWPSIQTRQDTDIVLHPVLSWKAKISEVKKLPKGYCIAYDCTCSLTKNSTIAIVPVGYYDGIPREISNKGYFLVNGKKAPILGRIMMNMCVLDVSLCGKVYSGMTVTIIGFDGKEVISADDIAKLSNTINYEIVTRINPLIPRVIL